MYLCFLDSWSRHWLIGTARNRRFVSNTTCFIYHNLYFSLKQILYLSQLMFCIVFTELCKFIQKYTNIISYPFNLIFDLVCFLIRDLILVHWYSLVVLIHLVAVDFINKCLSSFNLGNKSSKFFEKVKTNSNFKSLTLNCLLLYFRS